MNAKMKRMVPWLLACGVGLAALAATTDALEEQEKAPAKKEKPSISIAVNEQPVSRDSKITSSFAPVVKQVAPSVVNIFTTKNVRSPYQDMLPFFQDPFRRFFGDPGNERPRREPRQFKQRNLGSGVIVTKDGYILTNDHVVEGADEVRVALAASRKEFVAKVVGRDPKTDIAVLRIDSKDLPFVTFADSDKIEVGDVVLAIGNPFGVGQTVTSGIISAVGRGGMGIEDYEDFIQTDAAINPGNSGGALVDAQGRLIGINTAILSRTGGNQGIGFAVPANLARAIMESLIRDGKVSRGFMGVAIQDITPELAKEFKAPDSGGALVGDVTAGSAAEEAGLKTGDVIIALNGKPVADSRSLRLRVGQMAPGSKAELTVLRDGKEQKLTVKLRELKDDQVAGAPEDTGTTDEVLRGVGVTDLTPAMRQQFKVPEQLQGAVITEVAPDSAAQEAGLRQGDVILEINRKPIHSAEDAIAATQNVKSKKTLVRVWTRGSSRYIVVDETEAK
jgi:serine protease Do